jgi:hypothetical protein
MFLFRGGIALWGEVELAARFLAPLGMTGASLQLGGAGVVSGSWPDPSEYLGVTGFVRQRGDKGRPAAR